ncbi:MAG: type II secretion system F family protein, partial [Candidatus Micrarchaeota archaeon]|nr:type II secretion system F family protein [Candidatus Micrarchaeota archaeon]
MRFSEQMRSRVKRALMLSGLKKVEAEKYLSGAFLLSLLLGAVSTLASLFFFPLPESCAAGAISFALCMGIFLALPHLLASRRRAAAEGELPLLLRELAVYIDIGMPLEKAIAKVGKADYLLSSEFSECARQISSGSAIPNALASLSSGTDSFPLKRAVLALSSIYETGGKSEPIKRMADDLSSEQLSSMRAQAGRFSLLAIAFIAASALVPSFFTVYAAVAPAIAGTGEQLGSFQVWLAFLVVFPAIDIAMLCIMALFMPPGAKRAGADFSIANEYVKKRVGIGLHNFLIAIAAVSVALAAFSYFSGFAALSLLFLAAAPAAYAAISYLAQSEISKAELMLPDALYGAACTHKIFSSERMLSFLAKGGFGRISEAFEIALRRQKAGEDFESSLLAAHAHCPSPLLGRALSLLAVSHQTGADMYFAMRETASDVASFFSLLRERAALLSIQKYTLLAASALLVPAILGSIA